MTICCLLLIFGTCLSFSSGNEVTGREGLIDPEFSTSPQANAFAEQVKVQRSYFQEFFKALNNFEVYRIGFEKTVARFSKSIRSLNKSENANLETCCSHMSKVLQDSLKSDLYALKMLDAWGHPNGGLLEGSAEWPGHYSECRKAKGKEINGKWCNAIWGFGYLPQPSDNPIDVSLGTCFPSTCSEDSIKVILSAFLNISKEVPPLLQVFCTTPVSESLFTTADIIGIVVSSIIVTVIGMATVMDAVIRLKQTSDAAESGTQLSTKSTKFVNIMLCFSAISNGEKALDMSKGPGAVPVLDGIRFFSTTWIILFHSLHTMLSGIDNVAYANRVAKSDPLMMPITNGTLAVDTFFFLGGFLVANLGMKKLNKTKGHLNIPLLYLKRYLRLTPLYAYLILFSVGLYKYTGSGPFWQGTAYHQYNQCKDQWYFNLLYINNIYPVPSPVTSCFGLAWYLASDMQFYVLSPIFLLLLYKSKRLGSLLISIVLFASILTTGLLAHFSDLQPNPLNTAAYLKQSYRFFVNPGPQLTYDIIFQYDVYYAPWCRIGVYMIGMLTGYILYEYRGKIRMHKIVALLGWILSAAVALTIVYGLYPYVRDSTNVTKGLAGFYESLFRPIWALCLSWVVIACVSGYGGLITTFLNWQVFTPLSRLTYSAYLIHVLVLNWYLKSQESMLHYLNINLAYYYLGTLVITFGCAFVASIFVEWPIINLMKIVFPSPQSKTLSTTLHDGEDPVENRSRSDNVNTKEQHLTAENIGGSTNLDEIALPKQNAKSSFENGGYQNELPDENNDV